ncbi:MAG TPA: hypothetical protein VFZ89_00445 [Solirubrobacteraceae bacterium]
MLAVLLPALTIAYLSLAPSLPASGSEGLRLDAAVGAALVMGAVLAVAPLAEAWPAAVLLALGCGLLTGAFDQVGARAGATLPEALLWCAGGLLFARAFGGGALAVAVPLLLAGLDIAGVTGSTAILDDVAQAGDPLTLELPAWGGGQAAVLPALEAGVMGALAAWASMQGFRTPWTQVIMVESVVLATVLSLPAIAVVVAAYLIVNVDRAGESVGQT